MKTIAAFSNKGGVGQTSLVYHLAWMYAELGLPVLAADLDPQAKLTSLFLDEDRLEELWPDGNHPNTIYGAVQPLLDGAVDIASPHVEQISDELGLLAGDLALASTEDELSSQWTDCLDRKPRAFRVISALWRVLELAARERGARLVLIDIGPNLGAINRAVLIAAEHVVVPLAPDLCSLQGLKNVGPTLRRWRTEWDDRRARNPLDNLSIPPGTMTPAGYVVMQEAVRLDRPANASNRWLEQIPRVYREAILGETGGTASIVASDPANLAVLKHYRSLMLLAREARKPMFLLRAADGALGGHARAVQDCYNEYRSVARQIAQICGIQLP
jgi:cellulose biosynthesis protein BcsQ